MAERRRWPGEEEGAPGEGAEQRRAVWMCGGCGAQQRSDSEWRERRFRGESWGVFLEEGGGLEGADAQRRWNKFLSGCKRKLL